MSAVADQARAQRGQRGRAEAKRWRQAGHSSGPGQLRQTTHWLGISARRRGHIGLLYWSPLRALSSGKRGAIFGPANVNQPLTPPTYDPPAVLRWPRVAPRPTPWLHEEVARRMFERLQWIRHKPQAWTHWSPLNSGQAAHRTLMHWCDAPASMVEAEPMRLALARQMFERPWWQRWRGPSLSWQEPAPHSQDLIWANMVLHTEIEPQALLLQWQKLLRADGFVMFSCLGPDTALELRQLYQDLGWPPAGAEFTDMHDWGDMLVGSGFAEPVMDMERLTLTFAHAEAVLAELRQWGRNVHPGRFPALRGRNWRSQLVAAIEQRWPRQADGRLTLTVELVYGHALKSAAGPKLGPLSTVSIEAMREMLQRDRPR